MFPLFLSSSNMFYALKDSILRHDCFASVFVIDSAGSSNKGKAENQHLSIDFVR